MRRFFLFLVVAFSATIGCTQVDVSGSQALNQSEQIAISPVNVNGSTATRGYVEAEAFEETYCTNLHSAVKQESVPRTMQMSSYLYPQNGKEGNYFVNMTFSKGDEYWHANPAVYWPVGGSLDFLAFSLTTESQYNKGITVAWNKENAASQVVLTVPAENTQNDILFASASNVKAQKVSAVLPMDFNHAQAWLEFVLTASAASSHSIVHLRSIELEDVYNAGTLTISNNGGETMAQWDFSGQKVRNVKVDNIYNIQDLNVSEQYMDMLIPQQPKTAFVIYYTLGSDDHVLSYRFVTDHKTWLMGEKYIYKININANEISVDPYVSEWAKESATESVIKVEYDEAIGNVAIEMLDDADVAPIQTITGTCNTWGGRVKLTATVNAGLETFYRFEKWSDGSIENPHIVIATGDALYGANFTDQGPVISVGVNNFDRGLCSLDGSYSILCRKVAPGAEVTIEATANSCYKFLKWSDGNKDNPRTVTVNEGDDNNYIAIFAPADALTGEFTVNSAGKKVLFSKGNFRETWNGVSYEGGFAAHQYDYVGNASGNTTIKSQTSGAIVDLFGFSTNATTYGISTSTSSTNYKGAFKDWGTAIITSIDDMGMWFTLSIDEWDYLLNRSNSYAKAIVNSVSGLILLPDSYTHPADVAAITNINSPTANFDGNNYGIDDWGKMESAGCVFLPTAGYRNGSTVSAAGGSGLYWSSSIIDDYNIHNLNFIYNDLTTSNTSYRYQGLAVRLVTYAE